MDLSSALDDYALRFGGSGITTRETAVAQVNSI